MKILSALNKPSLLLIAVNLTLAIASISASAQQTLAVRNDVPRLGQQEVIMMRHAYLEKGQYDYWYEQSSTKVWPWFERLGARIIGDFQITYPFTDNPNPEQDEALRFARYASYEHWQATRTTTSIGDTGGSDVLAGRGGLSELATTGIQNRRQVSQGSKEAIFLQGYMAETRPIYMPGTRETFSPATGSNAASSSGKGVSLDVPVPATTLLALEYRRIKKGSFEEFHAITETGVYPYLEKVGARPVGQWKIVYYPTGTAVESPNYDEVYTLIRYGGAEHYQRVINAAVDLGGDGPDYEQLVSSLGELNSLTLDSSNRFLSGALFDSPPINAPAMDGEFKLNP